MRFETSQHMKMGQTMRMAPRMIQSMEILQMALPELEERVGQELESNPTLELADGSGEPVGDLDRHEQTPADEFHPAPPAGKATTADGAVGAP